MLEEHKDQESAQGVSAWSEKPGVGKTLERGGEVSETLLESEAQRKMDVEACYLRPSPERQPGHYDRGCA